MASGWFQRAARLLEDEAECPEHGWLALFEGHGALLGGDAGTACGWAPFGTGTTYLNFNGRAGGGPDAGVREGHGPKLRRLAEVKAVYDPGNLFRANHNIAPAAA